MDGINYLEGVQCINTYLHPVKDKLLLSLHEQRELFERHAMHN